MCASGVRWITRRRPVRAWPARRWSRLVARPGVGGGDARRPGIEPRAAQECQRERAALDRQWRLRLERAAQDADRAFRQYNAVEPENRLVARTLERQWEEALLAQRSLEEQYHRFQQAQPVQLSAAECAEIEALAGDLPALWQAPTTSVEEKRQVVRLLLQRVVVWAPPIDVRK